MKPKALGRPEQDGAVGDHAGTAGRSRRRTRHGSRQGGCAGGLLRQVVRDHLQGQARFRFSAFPPEQRTVRFTTSFCGLCCPSYGTGEEAGHDPAPHSSKARESPTTGDRTGAYPVPGRSPTYTFQSSKRWLAKQDGEGGLRSLLTLVLSPAVPAHPIAPLLAA